MTASNHTYRGIIFDHAQFGPTCEAIDNISLAEQLPDMEIG
jgi:hypothetical protein